MSKFIASQYRIQAKLDRGSTEDYTYNNKTDFETSLEQENKNIKSDNVQDSTNQRQASQYIPTSSEQPGKS